MSRDQAIEDLRMPILGGVLQEESTHNYSLLKDTHHYVSTSFWQRSPIICNSKRQEIFLRNRPLPYESYNKHLLHCHPQSSHTYFFQYLATYSATRTFLQSLQEIFLCPHGKRDTHQASHLKEGNSSFHVIPLLGRIRKAIGRIKKNYERNMLSAVFGTQHRLSARNSALII